ncbi:tripartite tricarboxylate transporter substrate binding protein [Hydrogenophaga sp.]|uniref:Bug family tripartite tricarboxylate transporter substrate binding protein n=1 Tax=Hydrogenophaga sp. TaxID=1904254 RepID=UPI00271BC368|nr:tripartite tricarboxylate transporter substrate binding protein [Hydrogenophaga sp.]MDO9437684.1 tripartite tricarboxylate transporter substrate binding protein [Hydrogenophaga sp.]
MESNKRRKMVKAGALALALGFTGTSGFAQSYPTKPVRMLLPFPAGGTADAITRYFAQKMSVALGQPFVVENVAGASGTIGLNQGLKAAPDGYTITQISNTNTVAAMHMFKKLPFNPLKDMIPLANLYEIPSAVITSPKNTSLATFPDFVAYAKAHPGKLSYSYSHATGAVTGASVKLAANVDIVAIPYKSGPQAVVETMSGEVALLCTDIGAVMSQIKAGNLKALAVTSARRSPMLPDVPTLREVLPSPMEFVGWGGFVVPVGTPPAVVNKLSETILQILGTEETAVFLQGLGATRMAMGPAEFARFMAEQEPQWGKALSAANIRPE